eukprot:2089594-Lingulodinium_polyedra.AAC.1
MAYVMAKPPPPALPAGHVTLWAAAVPARVSAPIPATTAQHTDTLGPAGPSTPAACATGAPGPQ